MVLELGSFQVTATISGGMLIQVDSFLGASLDGVGLFALNSQPGLLGYDPGGPGLGAGLDAFVLIDVVAGQTYAIELASLGGYRGGYTLAISTTSGDGFGTTIADATPLNLGSQATTVDGLVDAPGGGDVFRVEAPSTGQLTVTEDAAQGSGLDSFLVVYNDSGLQIAVNDDSGGTLNSLVDVPVRGGDTYFIQAGGYGVSTGAFVLTIQPTTPIVDDYSGFATAPDRAAPGRIRDAVGDDHRGPGRGRVDAGGRDDQPLRVPAPVSGSMTVQLATARADAPATALSIFTVLNGVATQIAGDDPGASGKGDSTGAGPTVTFAVTAGQTYFLEVAPASGVSVTTSFEYTLSFRTATGAGALGPVVSETAGQITAAQLTAGYVAAASATSLSAASAASVNALLSQSFLAALAGGGPNTNYLILWLDPVNFNLTNAQGRQMGFTQQGGPVQENSGAFLAGTNTALQLLIVPGVSLTDTFQLDLTGVGTGSVLDGRRAGRGKRLVRRWPIPARERLGSGFHGARWPGCGADPQDDRRPAHGDPRLPRRFGRARGHVFGARVAGVGQLCRYPRRPRPGSPGRRRRSCPL